MESWIKWRKERCDQRRELGAERLLGEDLSSITNPKILAVVRQRGDDALLEWREEVEIKFSLERA